MIFFYMNLRHQFTVFFAAMFTVKLCLDLIRMSISSLQTLENIWKWYPQICKSWRMEKAAVKCCLLAMIFLLHLGQQQCPPAQDCAHQHSTRKARGALRPRPPRGAAKGCRSRRECYSQWYSHCSGVLTQAISLPHLLIQATLTNHNGYHLNSQEGRD